MYMDCEKNSGEAIAAMFCYHVLSVSHGVNADDDTLLNLFQIVVLTFAYTAHCEKRSKEFIEKSLRIPKRP